MNITNTKPHITSNALQNRFASLVSENHLKKADTGVVPANTRSNLQQAERNFIEWEKQHNQQELEDPEPLDLLQSHDAELVYKTICKFVVETRNSSGQHYPPATIRSLLSGINHTMKENKASFSILDKDAQSFAICARQRIQ